MTNKITYELSDYLIETYGNDVSFSIKNASYDTVWSNEKLEELLEWGNTNSDAKPTWDSIKHDYTAKADLKASAKAKLIAGEALTEAEADTIVL